MNRDERIVKLHTDPDDPMTLSAIGEKLDLSRERVRQIVRAAGVDREHTQEVARVARAEAKRTAKQLICDTCDGPVTRVPSRIRSRVFCSADCRNRFREWAREELIEEMTAMALDLGHTPSQNELNANDDVPSHTTFVREFGSLTAAQEAAGLHPNRRGYPPSELPEGYGR